MMFCHKLYIIECINLIINKEAHLLLTVGNKIVTKKRRNRFAVGFMCKGNKRQNIRKNKAGEKRNILFLFASIYFAVNTNRFSPFWISIQSDKLKLNFHLPEKKFLLLFAI